MLNELFSSNAPANQVQTLILKKLNQENLELSQKLVEQYKENQNLAS
jgi:hypothetical protein